MEEAHRPLFDHLHMVFLGGVEFVYTDSSKLHLVFNFGTGDVQGFTCLK